MTALGAAAAQYGGAGLGLHAAQEAVGLRAAATVGLKGTLRHRNSSKLAGVSCRIFSLIAAIIDCTLSARIFTGRWPLSERSPRDGLPYEEASATHTDDATINRALNVITETLLPVESFCHAQAIFSLKPISSFASSPLMVQLNFFRNRCLKSLWKSVLLSNPIRRCFSAGPVVPHSALRCTTPLRGACDGCPE